MPTVPVTKFQANCVSILDEVKRTGEEVLITRNGKPVARLVAIEKPRKATKAEKKRIAEGWMKGTGEIVGDIVNTSDLWKMDA